MEVDSTESLEKSVNNTNGNITDNTALSYEGAYSGHIEQNIEVDSTEKCDKLVNDFYDNTTIPDNTVLSNEGIYESQTEQNMEIDSILDHDVVLLNNGFNNKIPDSVLSLEKSVNNVNGNITTDNTASSNEGAYSGHIEQNIEVDSTEKCDKLVNDFYDNTIPGIYESQTEQNMEVDSILDHDVVLLNNGISNMIPDKVLSSNGLEPKNNCQLFGTTVSSSDVKPSEPSIKENVLDSVSESSDQPIKENLVNTSSQPLETIISSSVVKSSEPAVKENVFDSVSEKSDQPIKENLVNTSSQLLETIISSSVVRSSELPLKKNVVDSVSEKSDQPIKENNHIKFDTPTKNIIVKISDQPLKKITSVSNDKNSEQVIEKSDKTGAKATNVSDPVKKNIAVPDVETSSQPKKENTTGSGNLITEQPCKKVISVSAIVKSDKPLKEIIVASCKQPTNKKIDKPRKELLKRIITEPNVKISEQLKKKMSVSTVVNTLSNAKLPIKTEYLNIDKIAVPKTVKSNIISNQTVLSSQIKKVQPVTFVSGNSFVRIQPKLITTENNLLKQKPEFKIVSSSESKPGVLLVPHNGMNYVVKKFKKEESNNKSIKPNSLSSAIKLNSAEIPQNFKGKKKFVTLLEKCPNGTFKMVQSAKPLGLNQQNANNFIIKTDKQPISMKYLNANGLRLVSQKSNAFAPTSLSNFRTIKKDISLIPHTITSKDLTENNTNTVPESNKNKMNTNAIREKCTSNLHLLPKTDYINEPALQIVSNVAKLDKIKENDGKNFRIIPIKSVDKSQFNKNTRPNVEHLIPTIIQDDEDLSNKSSKRIIEVYPNDINLPEVLSCDKNVEQISNKNKLSFNTGNIKKKRKILLEGTNHKTSNLVSCHNADCDAMVFDTELVGNLYCSTDCQKLARRTITIELPPPVVKPKIDRKSLLLKLQSSIQHRRRQKLLLKNSAQHDNSSVVKVNDSDVSNKVEYVPNIPKIYPELSDFNTCKASDISYSKPLEEKNDHTTYENMNIPIVPQLVEDNYLRSLEEGKQILTYVKTKEFKSAPKKLFDKPFPMVNNTFKVNQKLEGIDPEHEALFCVLSVAEIRGYRLKLHFDGYSDDYDFWVNADCPNIFHIKWCEEHSRSLQPPFNYEKPFDWSVYLRETRAFPAPKSCFSSSVNTVYFKSHKFCIGAKLEALDKVTRTLPKQLICVATVADVMGTRIRVHFDGWSEDFDYWTSISSTNLHPIGWCDSNGRCLTPPCGYNDFKGKKPFSWTEYLKETNSEPVPEDAFVRMPLREFTIEMSIEVVDLVIPSLMRVAKVVDVKDNEIKILYDGFTNNYAYWIEDDSPDIHPIGWCFKTHHPLEVPPEVAVWSCKVVGCNGKGNLYHYKTDHINAKECPYELDSWKKSVNGLLKVPDRLKPDETTKPCISAKNSKQRKIENLEKVKNKRNISSTIEPEVFVKPKNKMGHEKSNSQLTKTSKESNRTSDVQHFDINHYNRPTLAEIGIRRNRYKLLGDIALFTTSDPRTWSVKEVAECANRAMKNENTKDRYIPSSHFIDNEIDGESFLMLTKKDLITSMKLPLGPAVKIYHTIKLLQERSIVFNNIVL